jgi:histidyl-tRNA synthetase
MSLTAPPGVFDVIPHATPDSWRSSHLWTHVESIARHQAELFGFGEIRTPLFEREELFSHNVGATTDIVTKEMYTFLDKSERRLALRPEGTLPVMRAFLEHRLAQQGQQHKLFYLAAMFRYERAQAGRYRQHHQFGVGVASPAQDVEVVDLLWSFYRSLGLRNLTLHINSLGKSDTRQKYRQALIDYFSQYRDELSADSQRRLDTNPLRILDSKDVKDQKIIIEAPQLIDYLDDASRCDFETFCGLLTAIGIPYQINSRLVRGLDYYNGVVFEVTSDALGSQNSIGGGGRYDGMLKNLGGPDLPTCGFGTGIERVIQTMLAQDVAPQSSIAPLIYIIPLGALAHEKSFVLLHELRQAGIRAQMELGNRKLNKAMHQAHNCRAHYTAIIGEDELAKGHLSLKHMQSGTQTEVAFSGLIQFLQQK